jgi:curved DNA-binding protein CbpA
MSIPNFYEILGVHRNSDGKEIRSKYLALAKLYHPDRRNGDPDKFKSISAAYWTLKNVDRRRHYDLRLRFQEITHSPRTYYEMADRHFDAGRGNATVKSFWGKRARTLFLIFLIVLICMNYGVSNIESVGTRGLLIGGAFAVYFLSLMSLLKIL